MKAITFNYYICSQPPLQTLTTELGCPLTAESYYCKGGVAVRVELGLLTPKKSIHSNKREQSIYTKSLIQKRYAMFNLGSQLSNI